MHVYTSFCVKYYVKQADLTWLSPYLETRNRERTETGFSENGQSLQFFFSVDYFFRAGLIGS